MNVFDFDGTIYNGDSTVDFYLYCLKHHRKVLLKFPRQIWGLLLYSLKRIGKTAYKAYFFSFLTVLPQPEECVLRFWAQNRQKILPWYLSQQQPEDLVISASPRFLLEPICRELGIRFLIASEVNPHSGKFSGENCRGAEKVVRFHAQFGDASIRNFYSDSLSDLPLAQIAENSFLIQNGVPVVWDRA